MIRASMGISAAACFRRCEPAQWLRAGASRSLQTIYLGTDAGSVHAVTVGYPADALRDGDITAADSYMSQDQYKLIGNLYQAVRAEAPRCCLPCFGDPHWGRGV